MRVVSKALGRARLVLRGAARPRHAAIYRRFRRHTMVPFGLFLRNLELAGRFAHVPGIVVECGVWKGGMIGGLATALGPNREYFLFDSFDGLPSPTPLDGDAAKRWAEDPDSPWYFDNCRADIRFAEEAMRLAGVPRYTLVKGSFAETVPAFAPECPIAVLRLDGDWYESTLICLEYLYPKVAPGGVVIVDDYYVWDGCARAVHDYLSRTGSADRIRQYRDDVCYLVGPS